MELLVRVGPIVTIAVLLAAVLLPAQGANIAIAFKYVNEYSLIWDDSGSGTSRDVSIWRPVDIESGFSPLGDTATASHNRPIGSSLTVSAVVDGALARPTGFTEVWNDRGSGGDDDVRVLRMNPPSGYTCLGYVAIQGYDNLPSTNEYWCVKTEYVSVDSGNYQLIWNDAGSGADSNVALWANRNTDSADGIDATTFTAFATHNTPSGRPSLLNGTVSRLSSLIPRTTTDQLAIIVYQVTDTEGIWDDSGSDADNDFSSWRAREPSGYFSLGDIGVATHSAPRFSILARARKPDALAAPVNFVQRWNDAGSDADDDVAFYEPVCPPGYRWLGYVTIRSHSTLPSTDDIRCVKAEYTETGAWEFVWNDAGSDADTDVTVWKAVTSGSGQGVEAMSARPCHCDMIATPYVLNTDFIQYIVSRPVRRYILNDVSYQLDDRQLLSQAPEVLSRTTLINQGTTSQMVSRTITYSYEETHSWSTTFGLEIGISTTVTAGVPEVSSVSATVTRTFSFSYTTGETASESNSDEISAGVEVLPMSMKSAIITSNRYVVDVPFTATVTPVYTDDTMGSPYSFTGVYEGVQINDIQVVYGEDIPLPGSDDTPPPGSDDPDSVSGTGPCTLSAHLLVLLISAIVIAFF